MSNEIVLKQPFKVAVKKTGLAALKEKAASSELLKQEPAKNLAESAEHRIGIVFDDSGSMDFNNKIQDARLGIEDFLRSCSPGNTAVTIYPMCSIPIALTTNLPALALKVKEIKATGGNTPLLKTLFKMKEENSLTRIIVFSDGSPDHEDFSTVETVTKDFGIVDTVLFSNADTFAREYVFMKNLAEKTGGIFLRFKPGQSNFRDKFKYLSSGLRHLLADKSFADSIQR